jgi:predicted ATPase/class 3 adenylate cyclase
LHPHSEVRTYLFTDIEGSTRMWEESPEKMRPALARHDALARAAVESHRGVLVKRTGDGLHAVFRDPADALAATLQLQLALSDPQATAGVALAIRCGLHAGADEPRDGDFYGTAVNRAARIMSTAHGGQVLLSHAVNALLDGRLPPGCGLKELGTVRLRDLASPERLYQLLHPGLRDKFPALRSLETTPNNLPHQLSSFVGRDAEVAEVKKLVEEYRLVTLLGIGGIGKSRLSLQAGAELLDAFPDGVWLVELATLTDPRLVAQTVASVLGVKEGAGRPVLEALVKFFRDRRLLLILDNCEHLLAACADLARQILQAGPHSKVLGSSREPLRVAGETTYAVPTLPDTVAERLFVERARAAKSGFRVDGSRAAVASICKRLDGIPLAVELAAARVRSLSPEAIASRLDDRFRLLTRGDQTALPRQQTLRALIDWSYELLDEAERAVFRRLAVFAGGWTLDAAERIASFGEVAEADVLDRVTALVEKSLVVADAGGERYRYLETVREYAYERLGESQELADARQRHLEHYVAFAEKARTQPARIDLERENLLAAHAWCDRAPNGAALGLQLATQTKHYWYSRGLLLLGRRIALEALARPPAAQHTLERCRVLLGAGQFSNFMGRYTEARQYLEQSLGLARSLGDQRRIAVTLQPLGMAYHGEGDTAGAEQHFLQGMASAQALGDPRELASATNALAQLYRSQGLLDKARPLYDKFLEIARTIGDREFIAVGLLNLAMVAIAAGELEAARQPLLETARIAVELGSKAAGQNLLEVCTGLAAARHEWQRAARFYGAAEAQAEQTGLHRDPADDAFLQPRVAEIQAAMGGAALAEAEGAGRALAYEAAIAEASAWLLAISRRTAPSRTDG